MNQENCKVTVVGSGPGGSVAATLIAEHGHDVILIEAGDYFSVDENRSFSTEEMHKQYKNGGLTLAFGKSKINYVEGQCVGGGSEINSGLFHRLPSNILSVWQREYNLSISEKELSYCYDQIESDINVSFMPNVAPKASLKLKEGADSLGWECMEVPRWYKYEDSSEGKKQSMTETFIPRFLKAGGELRTKHFAKRVAKRNGKFTTYCDVVNKNGEKFEKEIKSDFLFLAAGSINTPLLLLNSGIKRQVGNTLKMHPSFKFTAQFTERVNFPGMGVPVHQVKEFSPKVSLGCSISSYPYIGLSLNDTGNIGQLNNWKNMANYYAMISPEGNGKIYNMPFSREPFVKYSLTKEDYNNLKKGYRSLAKLLFEAGAIELFPSVNVPLSLSSVSDVKKIDELSQSLLNLMTIHLFSSVPMGGNRKEAPVKPNGELWDIPGLYISDGSILCDSPTVNPQGTIMAFSMKNTLEFLNTI